MKHKIKYVYLNDAAITRIIGIINTVEAKQKKGK